MQQGCSPAPECPLLSSLLGFEGWEVCSNSAACTQGCSSSTYFEQVAQRLGLPRGIFPVSEVSREELLCSLMGCCCLGARSVATLSIPPWWWNGCVDAAGSCMWGGSLWCSLPHLYHTRPGFSLDGGSIAQLAGKMPLALLEGTVNSLDQFLVSGCGQERKYSTDT